MIDRIEDMLFAVLFGLVLLAAAFLLVTLGVTVMERAGSAAPCSCQCTEAAE